MKIIKQGKIPMRTKQAICEYCGCIFEADYGEYTTSSQMEVMHDGLPNYKCKCPFCDKEVYFD